MGKNWNDSLGDEFKAHIQNTSAGFLFVQMGANKSLVICLRYKDNYIPYYHQFHKSSKLFLNAGISEETFLKYWLFIICLYRFGMNLFGFSAGYWIFNRYSNIKSSVGIKVYSMIL